MAEDISRSIEPGSMEYGDRQIVEDRMRQIQSQSRKQIPPGTVSKRTTDRLAQGPVSDKPVTAGLSVGPGPGPSAGSDPTQLDEAARYRLMAEHARNPYMRHLARNALRALVIRSKQ